MNLAKIYLWWTLFSSKLEHCSVDVVEDIDCLSSLEIGIVYVLIKTHFWCDSNLFREYFVSFTSCHDRNILGLRSRIRKNSLFISLRFTLNLCYLFLWFRLKHSNIGSDFLGPLFLCFCFTLLPSYLGGNQGVFSLIWELDINDLDICTLSENII